ncbi:RNA-directed DNA polymerase, eukaryota [Tanacetum coccineum]
MELYPRYSNYGRRIRSFTYKTDFTVLEDIGEYIENELTEIVMGKTFKDLTHLEDNRNNGLISFSKGRMLSFIRCLTWCIVYVEWEDLAENLYFSSDDEEDAEDDGSQSGDKVTTDNYVERVFESSCMHNNDLLYDNNHNNIMPDKEKVLSEDPFNLYDILNKRRDSGDNLKYPPGFTLSVVNVEEVNKKVKGATNWWDGDCVIMGDFNKVRTEQERYGSVFNVQGANAFNIFISLASLIDLPLDGYAYTWAHKTANKIKLNDINSIDSLEAAHKSKVRWPIEGDENTKFFHDILNSKRSQLAIHGTLVDGEWIIDPLAVKTDLERNIFNEEIKSAVWDYGTNKSPGPDGFTFKFFSRYWKLLEHDIVAVVKEFFASALGWLLEEILMTWAQLEKKQTRPRLYTNYLEEIPNNSWRRRRKHKAMASGSFKRRRQGFSDGFEYAHVIMNPTSAGMGYCHHRITCKFTLVIINRYGFAVALAVLVTGASQSRQHGKSESDSYYLSD